MAEIAGLHYEIRGAADGPPLILSAGLGGSAAYWAPNLDALARRHRLILYDHRGTGRSDRALPPDLSVDDMADDVLALMDGLGLAGASLIGHAAGGAIGLALALKAPHRLDRLVVVNGFARPDPHFRRCFDTRLALLRDSGVAAFLRAQPIFLYPARWISEMTAGSTPRRRTSAPISRVLRISRRASPHCWPSMWRTGSARSGFRPC